MKINLSCIFCGKHHTTEAEAPGWRVRHGTIENENALCPDHAIVGDFMQEQCPGCVAGWPDCGLYMSCAYCDRERVSDGYEPLTEDERALIKRGGCPRRVNGSFTLDTSKSMNLEELNLSDPASPESGQALLDAIDGYLGKWAKKDGPYDRSSVNKHE